MFYVRQVEWRFKRVIPLDGWELDPWPGALESGIQLKESEILLSIGIRNPVEHFPHVETFFCSVNCVQGYRPRE